MTKLGLLLLVSLAAFAQGGFRGPGRYEIYSPLSRKVLDMDRNDRSTIIQFESRRTDNQVWDISDAGGGFYYIRNGMNGYALAVRDNRNSTPLVAEPFNNAPNQQWRFENGNDSSLILVNRNGKAIDIPYGSTNDGVKVNSYNRNGEVNQRWMLQEASNVGTSRSSSSGSRYDRTNSNSSRNRYDNPAASGQQSTDGVAYYDDQARMYKMDGDGACFYRDRNFQGEAVCATVRSGRRRWNAPFTEIGSVKLFGRATGVQFFDKEEFRGNSVEVTGDANNFNRASKGLRNVPQSMRVY